MAKGTKGQRYSKNCLRIRGRQELFIKGEVLVNFAPLPKKYSFQHVEKTSNTHPSCQRSTETPSITLSPSSSPPLNTKLTKFWSRTTTGESVSPSFRSVKWYLFSNLVLSKAKEPSSVLWSVSGLLRGLQGARGGGKARVASGFFLVPAIYKRAGAVSSVKTGRKTLSIVTNRWDDQRGADL